MLTIFRRRFGALTICLITWFLLIPVVFAQTVYDFNLPPQALADSLRAIGHQTSVNILFDSHSVEKLTAPAIHGQFSASEAVNRVLAGTNLAAEQTEANTLLVEPKDKTGKVQGAGALNDPPDDVRGDSQEAGNKSSQDFRVAQVDQTPTGSMIGQPKTKNSEKAKDEGLTEIVVTGTHIRGVAPIGSELKLYSHEDIELSGTATIDQFARTIPENFSGVDPISATQTNFAFAVPGQGAAATGAVSGTSSFNLYGLGPTATLTLLNGHRLASSGIDGSLVDVSMIPLSAVDHIEVLAAGASAIYGADAVAGVVNIVTRKDFDGAESSLRYGGATDGGATQFTGSQILGESWGGGNALITYDYDHQGGLDASQRDYIPNQGGPLSLVPKSSRNSVLLFGGQDLGANTRFTIDAIYSNRDATRYVTDNGTSESISSTATSRVTQSGVTLNVDQALSANWRADLTGSYQRLQQWSNSLSTVIDPSLNLDELQLYLYPYYYDSHIQEVQAVANGPLLSLPGGPLRAAVGASFRQEQFDIAAVDTTITTPASATTSLYASAESFERHVGSAYGEVSVPLVGEGNSQAWARRLEISAAVRFDHYSDFGSSTNPKYGLSWEPTQGLHFRTSYGTSFQAPLLSQLHSPITYLAAPVGDTTSPSGSTDTLYTSGGNSQLQAQSSRSLTAGFDWEPTFIPQFGITGSYFHIKFSERIGIPQPQAPYYSHELNDPTIAPFIIRNPPLAEVQAAFNSLGFRNFGVPGPSSIRAILVGQYENIAASTDSGVDLTLRYRVPTQVGDLNFSLGTVYYLENDYQTTFAVPSVSILNTFGEPTKWKGHGSVGWAHGGFKSQLTINYVNAYQDTLVAPSQRIDSWTTADLYLGYSTGTTPSSYSLRNITFALNVQNLTNKEPPYVDIPVGLSGLRGQPSTPIDSANASPVGRFISLQITKNWGGK